MTTKNDKELAEEIKHKVCELNDLVREIASKHSCSVSYDWLPLQYLEPHVTTRLLTVKISREF